MNQIYTYTDFKNDVKKWWFLIIIGIVVACALSFLIKGKYESAAIIHIKNENIYSVSNDKEELSIYKMNFNAFARNIYPVIVPRVLERENKSKDVNNVTKNLQVIANLKLGYVELKYSSENAKDSQEMVNNLANEAVSYLTTAEDKSMFSISYKGLIKTKEIPLQKRIWYATIAGILGGIVTVGFVMFLELILSFKRK